jgi:hypothetical protein
LGKGKKNTIRSVRLGTQTQRSSMSLLLAVDLAVLTVIMSPVVGVAVGGTALALWGSPRVVARQLNQIWFCRLETVLL